VYTAWMECLEHVMAGPMCSVGGDGGPGAETILLDVDADGADARRERHSWRAAEVLYCEPLEHHLQHQRLQRTAHHMGNHAEHLNRARRISCTASVA
jgi:hypothetical protein